VVAASAATATTPPGAAVAPPDEVDEAALLGPGLTEPGWTGALGYGIPVLAAGIGVLAVSGLQPRLDEYRFRARRAS
ncbi:hypothetical protein ACWEVN_35190, partial [Amycolatopsis sp. NPDC003861]